MGWVLSSGAITWYRYEPKMRGILLFINPGFAPEALLVLNSYKAHRCCIGEDALYVGAMGA